MKKFWGTYHGSRKHRMMLEDRSVSPNKNFLGQSTVELALLLPTLALMLGLIIYAYRVNHKLSEQTHTTYAKKIYKYHTEGMIFDPIKGIYVPKGQYNELIPPDAMIDPGKLAGELSLSLIAQLGLSKLFDVLNIDTTTYGGAFAQGFSTSLAGSATSTLVRNGSLHEMNSKDVENATWAGGAAAFSSQSATRDFQGGEGADAGKITGIQELFGSGAQAGVIGYFNSHGDLAVAGTSAFGGMMNSDTTASWVDSGASGLSTSAGAEILRGATKGAVQSSASGIFGGDLKIKNVLIGAASNAVQTNAFADTLPWTGSDPKNSAMYGAFNGAFSSVVSGGKGTSVALATASGALGSAQTAQALGGNNSFKTKASNTVGGAGMQYLSGSSLSAVGVGALSSAVGSGTGWAGNQVSGSLSSSFSNAFASNKTSSSNNVDPATAKMALSQPNTANDTAQDPSFIGSTDALMDATVKGVMEGEVLESMEPKEGPRT